jgi:hypothetical protein
MEFAPGAKDNPSIYPGPIMSQPASRAYERDRDARQTLKNYRLGVQAGRYSLAGGRTADQNIAPV